MNFLRMRTWMKQAMWISAFQMLIPVCKILYLCSGVPDGVRGSFFMFAQLSSNFFFL